jgi:hypothetical protein
MFALCTPVFCVFLAVLNNYIEHIKNMNYSCKFSSYTADCTECRLRVLVRPFIVECVHFSKLEDLLLCLLWILTLLCGREGS